MRLLSLIVSILFFQSISFGQIYDPVKWTMDYKQVSEKEFDLIFTAKIDDKWGVYSQFLEGDEGPIPTTLNFDEGTHYKLKGKAKETGSDVHDGIDPIFRMQIKKFKHDATLTQRVIVNDISKPISGYLNFMTCDDERCLPPADVDFEFALKSKPAKQTKPNPKSAKTEKVITKAVESKPKTQVKTTHSNTITPKTSNSTTKITKKTQPKISVAKNKTSTIEQPAKANQNSKSKLINPVHWNVNLEQIAGDEYNMIFKATLDKTWNIYSQFTEDNGPIPSAFDFTPSENYTKIGKTTEKGHKKEGMDPLFGVNVIKFNSDEPVYFTQKLKITDLSKPISGYFSYMACDETHCLTPQEKDFIIYPDSKKTLWGSDATDAIDNIANGKNSTASTSSESGLSMYPADINNVDLDKPVAACGEKVIEKTSSIWTIFILGFLGGLVALLTPCVFPMIPLTVSFFTKGSENRKKGIFNAFLYGFFILMVYLLLSIPFHLLDSVSPDILNEISTNVYLNIGFFVIFIFFAFSFFGYYEITLPESMSNKSANAENAGGVIGIFFMALTLALVSFSCTGPILGSLLAGAMSSEGGAWQLTAGMGGFGVALALPFTLFALFPSWLNSMPKSGGWLTTVKVVLGFLELALAFKFLSNADLVTHWGLLKIEPFLIIWIIIFIGLALYLFGKIKFPHDSPIKKLSFGRISLAILATSFVIYLASGFMYNEKTESFTPLSLLSGLAPPVGYSWIHPKDCPQNLTCFHDLTEGMKYAKEVNKPILVDFTGYACVNCRKMEEHVWPVKSVFSLIDNDYVLISLYVDEKTALPENEQIKVKQKSGGTRKLRTKGNKWAHLQTEKFNTNAQPFYALISPDGKLLNNPRPYTPDADTYAQFLQCGLDAFETIKKK